MILACTAMMVNICLQTYLVSNMAALLTMKDVSIYAMRTKLRQLKDFTERYHLPPHLAEQLRAYFRFKFATDQELDQNVLVGLPELYRQQINHALYETIIKEVYIFQGCAYLFYRQLHGALNSTFYMPGHNLVNVDEPSTQLMIIAEGEALMYYNGVGVEKLESGACFSAVPFLCKVGYQFTVRTRTRCRILSLDRNAWEAASTSHPHDSGRVKDNLLKYCQQRTLQYSPDSTGSKVWSMLASTVESSIVQQREVTIAALCFAAARGDLDELKRFLVGHSASCADYDRRTPLHIAAASGRVEAIELLVERKAELSPLDNFGRTPLLEACRSRQQACAEVLHQKGAELGFSAKMTQAAQLHEKSTLSSTEEHNEHEELLSQSATDTESKYAEAAELCAAASEAEQLWYLSALLRYKADPNAGDYDRRTALHVACASGNKPAIEYLIKHPSIDMNKKDNFGRTPLMEAVRHSHDSCARLMAQHGASHGFCEHLADMTDPNSIPAGQELCQAAFGNQKAYLNGLITYCHVDVDASDYDLRTALMLACAEGNMDAAVSLVQHGADINRKDRWGHTAITEALDHGHPDLAAVIERLSVRARPAAGAEEIIAGI